jgi:uncharacterized protein (TIGR02118 family)
MVKLIAMLKRRPEMTLEEFLAYYTEQHIPLFARTIPRGVADAIVHYVQNHAVALAGGGRDPAFDVITEMGFEDMDGLRTWTSWYLGPEGEILREDETKFMDVPARVVVVTEVHHQPHR